MIFFRGVVSYRFFFTFFNVHSGFSCFSWSSDPTSHTFLMVCLLKHRNVAIKTRAITVFTEFKEYGTTADSWNTKSIWSFFRNAAVHGSDTGYISFTFRPNITSVYVLTLSLLFLAVSTVDADTGSPKLRSWRTSTSFIAGTAPGSRSPFVITSAQVISLSAVSACAL